MGFNSGFEVLNYMHEQNTVWFRYVLISVVLSAFHYDCPIFCAFLILFVLAHVSFTTLPKRFN